MIGTAARIFFVITLFCLLFAGVAMAIDLQIPDSYHNDFRSGLKARFYPEWKAPAGLAGEELALAFLADHADEFGVDYTRGELKLDDVRQSMRGDHYRFNQQLHGIDIFGAEIIVSIAHGSGEIYSTYNNGYPLANAPASPVTRIGEERAYTMAWNHLRIHGDLISEPGLELYWVPEADSFRLTYVVHVETLAPYGGWAVELDAQTGDILNVRDERLYRKDDEFTLSSLADRNAGYDGPTWNREETVADFRVGQSAQAEAIPRGGLREDGTGVVFDPDPRTSLRLSSLQDGHGDSYFTNAYFTRSLQDLTYSGGVYRVTGPWCNITQWDAPYMLPSTTVDGNWTAHRGDNSFNDAMTYYHIDQNQRYLQSMGFTGPTGIQDGSIQIDTNGCNGADNSYYIPYTNRIAYGHGCVDDNEDADVILHEYGHAIHKGINSNWGGGDTGAIGEGFGDYWGGTYSYGTPNGPIFSPTWMFTWDGHGDGNQCWYGRRFDCTALYNPYQTYSAHQSIGGGWQSDELWSTPLYQAMTTLVDDGYDRKFIDQIVIESHFGVGYGVSMRTMANATIAAAQDLQPGGPYAITFYQKFLARNIVEESTLAVDDFVEASGFKLNQSRPNPFQGRSNLSYSVPSHGAEIEIAVFDLNGRKVRSLVSGFHDGGDHEVRWQGDDENGEAVGSGVYFYRLRAGDVTEIRQMVLLK